MVLKWTKADPLVYSGQVRTNRLLSAWHLIFRVLNEPDDYIKAEAYVTTMRISKE